MYVGQYVSIIVFLRKEESIFQLSKLYMGLYCTEIDLEFVNAIGEVFGTSNLALKL